MHVPADNPAQRAWAITPSDTALAAAGINGVPFARGLLCSAACTLKVTTVGGDVVTIPAQQGYNPVAVSKVWATGSVLTNAGVSVTIVAWY